MNRDRSLFRHFGLNPETLFWGSAHESYASRVSDSVISRRMIGVVGGFGTGKSTLVREALQGVPNLEIVYVNNADRERLRIGQIMSAMIMILCTEQPKRDNMARCFQLARVVGEKVVVGRKEVVVVIENAHRMHANTILAIKDLRESTLYKGQAFLFSVILVGQETLRGKLEAFGEVAFRTRTVDLERNGWMDYGERVAYLDQVYGRVIDPETRNRLAALFLTPLELDHFVEEKLTQMRDAGVEVLDDSVMPLSVREFRELLKISQSELARLTGIPKSTISDVELGKNGDPALVDKLLGVLNGQIEGRTALRRVGS